MSGRFVAVIGTVNHDVITAGDGSRRESLGGILYNVLTLAVLLEGSGIRVRAIGRLGEEHRRQAMDLLAAFPAADGSGLIADAGGTNESWLDYSRAEDRVEGVELRVAPLTDADLAPAAGAEAVLVNMISGVDLDPRTLHRLAAAVPGPMLLDVQALARTRDAPRRPTVVRDAEAWAAPFDVVRGNEAEIGGFGGTPEDASAAARRILAFPAGPAEVLVTRGERGATRFERRGDTVIEDPVPAAPCPRPVDPTGCGDSFLAAVVAARALGRDRGSAARAGALVAARVAELTGLESLASLRELRERALSADPI
jgi:sugar/nucleoside kinase (ribokinase family)